MRKNALAMSIAVLIGGLGLAGVAHADVIVGSGTPTSVTLGATNATGLIVENGGIGHSLITPYYNAQNGNATIISVTNTDTVNGKVMKVRFRGASNSDDILDFTVLMSPGDVWNATISQGLTGVAQIVTVDRTCTVPQLGPGGPQSFNTQRLTTKGGADVNANTREGYIEIFNMADIPSTAAYGAGGNAQSALFTNIKHVGGAVPPCAANNTPILNAIVNTNHTTEASAAPLGLATPTTGLFGNWVIINVPQTTTYSGEMVAIRATGAGNATRGNFVVFPQTDQTYAGAPNLVTADPLLRFASSTSLTAAGVASADVLLPPITPLNFDLPDMSTPYTIDGGGLPVDPLVQAGLLTQALAVLNVSNEYVNDASITAKTDWVFSMPTRRYTVAMDYSTTPPRRLFSDVEAQSGVGIGLPYFHNSNTSVNGSQICVTAESGRFFDREEQTPGGGTVPSFSPGAPGVSGLPLCGEVSVLSFADVGNSVLAASVARQNVLPGYMNGWGAINTTNATTLLGLPILGASFIKATNPAAGGGFSGTYGFTSAHRFTR